MLFVSGPVVAVVSGPAAVAVVAAAGPASVVVAVAVAAAVVVAVVAAVVVVAVGFEVELPIYKRKTDDNIDDLAGVLVTEFSRIESPSADQPGNPVITTLSPVFAPLRRIGSLTWPSAEILTTSFSELEMSPPIT